MPPSKEQRAETIKRETGLTATQFDSYRAYHNGPWAREIRHGIKKQHGTRAQQFGLNQYTYNLVNTVHRDWPTDPDGPYAALLVQAGYRQEDSHYDVGGSGEYAE